MTNNQMALPASQKPLRLWPGAVAVATLWLARYVVPAIAPDIAMYSMIFGLLFGVLGFIVWWMFFSRAPGSDRWVGLAVMIVALVATPRILHKSIATGMMGMMFFIYAIPVVCLAFI